MEENIFQKIRNSAKSVTSQAQDVKIASEEIKNFTLSLDWNLFKDKTKRVSFPLNFQSIEEKINFFSVLDLLNFASGFRKLLHLNCKRGAYETICYGMMSIQISNEKIDSEFMSKVDVYEVSKFFGLPLVKKIPIQQALTSVIPHELKQLASLITEILNQSGKILKEQGCKDFSQFIFRCLEKDPSAAYLVSQLTSTFPAFNDVALYKNEKIFIFKKVQLLVADLYREFSEIDSRFKFESDIDQLTVFTDNVLPAVLRKLKILKLSDKLANIVDNGNELEIGEMEIELRICAIEACEQIVKAVHDTYPNQHFSCLELDYFLWTIGKDPEYRSLERHYTRGTIFY